MITVSLDTNIKIPLYMQLYEYIIGEIENGNIKKGEKLPSKRALSSHLKISIITVETAYAQLVAEGYIISKAGSGYYCDYEEETVPEDIFKEEKEKEENSEKSEILYDFCTNRIDTSDFPFSSWAKISREILSGRSDELLNACHAQGTPRLREGIAEYLRHYRSMDVSSEQIVIGAGTEYLTGLIIQLLGRDNAYGVENPGYSKVYDIFSANTSRVFPVPVDDKGADAGAIAGFGINVIHVTPSHHFPLGIVMPISRRTELLRWVYSREGRYIIEDDYDSEFRYFGRPLPAIQSMDKKGRVIYINTFTKTLAPSMRISYMVLPEELLHRFTGRLGFYSCTVPVFEQLTLAKFMENGNFDRHINRMKKIYRSRRDLMIKKISEGKLHKIVEITGCDAGMHMLLKVSNGMKQNELVWSAARQGVKVYGLSEYYSFPVLYMPENVVVAGFSGLLEHQIEEGIEALERAWT